MPSPNHYDGAPCWIDLITADSDKAKKFYGELFGWTFESGDPEKYGGYITAVKHGKTVAGLMQKQTSQAGMPDVWTTYLRTIDAAATAEAVKEHGGQIFIRINCGHPWSPPIERAVAELGHLVRRMA